VEPRLFDDVPVALVVYDLLELGGRDLRAFSLVERRSHLEALVSGLNDAPSGLWGTGRRLRLSPLIPFEHWSELARIRDRSREKGSEGIMLKRRASPYRVGRQRGDWWKWKIPPYTIDAVLVMAQPGQGKRAPRLTDYTFAVWNGEALVNIAKAYSGLTDEEILEVDGFVRSHTLERHGAAHVVRPELVFELAFESIQRSDRHPSGIAVRFPRIARWRRDKRAEDADTLGTLKALLVKHQGWNENGKREA
jgi:DNA ligase-1